MRAIIRNVGVVVAICAAAAVFSTGPLAAQAKNPIAAARDAIRKAREQQEQQKGPPPPPAAPTQTAAPQSAAAPNVATPECCSPEALGKLAKSVGFIDILGVKLGVTLEEAVAALKASNPKLSVDVYDSEVTAGGKVSRRPRFILGHLPASIRDGSEDAIGVQLTPPPGPAVVELVVRYIRFPDGAPVAASNILDALHKKYGAESWDEPAEMGWMFDPTGKLVKPVPFRRETCATVGLSLAGYDIRGPSVPSPGKVIGSVNSDAIFNQSTGFGDSSAKCTSYVEAQVLLPHSDPSKPVLAFYTTIQSSGLMHYSRLLTAAFIKGEDQNLRKQQEQDASKRTVPKL